MLLQERYGCQQTPKFNGQQTPPPFDLIVMTQMRWEYFMDGQGMSKIGNAYFYANMHCLGTRLPFFISSMLQMLIGSE